MRTFTAADVEIPVMALGTWRLSGEDARRMVRSALEGGYRHIDTAAMYGNEREVGEGLRDSGLARKDVFVTTKIWNDSFRSADLERSARERLDLLGLEQVDLLLLHWPTPEVPLEETMAALNRVLQRGWTRAIGVSNFTVELLDRAVDASEAPLAVNQVEYHPYLAQRRVKAALERHGMGLTAYSPLAHGKVAKDPVLKRIGDNHGLTPAQVTLAWLLGQDGVLAAPKTSNAERAQQNLKALEVTLTPEETAQISALARSDGRLINPGFAPPWDLAD